MKELLKYLLYEHAINVFFDNVKKNLFSSFNIIKFNGDNPLQGETYNTLVFNQNGFIYKFNEVTIIRLSDEIGMMQFKFKSAIVIDLFNETVDVEMWDENESPTTMQLDALVESI